MPTIRESIEVALEVLENRGFPPGGAVYDDLAQALQQLIEDGIAEDRLVA